MVECSTYFHSIPDELKLNIFAYLNTSDMILLCKIYPFLKNLLYERKITEYTNLFKCYHLTIEDLNEFFSKKNELCIIKVLNINSIYWIPAAILINYIHKLSNLETLFAFDTKLNMHHLNKILSPAPSKNCSIKTIAFSEKQLTLEIFEKINKLMFSSKSKHLYLSVDKRVAKIFLSISCTLKRCWVLQYFPAVEELLDYDGKKICYKPFYNLNYFNHKDGDNKVPHIMVEKLVECIGSQWNSENLALLNKLPFGKWDIQQILKNEYHNKFYFQELNFCHSHEITCSNSSKLKNFAHAVFTSEHVKMLKKAAFNICMCKGFCSRTEPKAKRARIEDETCTLEDIINNCPRLEEIEIWSCHKSQISRNKFLHDKIVELRHLKKITLVNILLQLNKNTIFELIGNCKSLEYLHIETTNSQTVLNDNICLAIKNAHSLKDFRFTAAHLSIDLLFNSLNELCSQNLRRICLHFNSVDKFSIKPFELFLKSNPNLLFLLVCIEKLSTPVHKQVQKTMNEYKTDQKKVFFSVKDLKNCFIPFVHKYDMVDVHSKISIFNYLENTFGLK